MDQDKLGEWLSAYLDGELEAEERALVERLLRDDQAARRLYDDLRQSVSLMSSLPRQSAPPSIAEDVQAFAERATLLGDTDSSFLPPQTAPPSRSPFLRILTMAAMVGLVAVGTWYVSTEVSGPAGISQRVAMVTDERALPLAAKEEAEHGAAAEKSDGFIDRDFNQDLLAAASFEQKLQNGMGVGVVRTHSFANEVVHLKVAVAGDSSRDTVTAKLVAYLEGASSVDLRGISLAADEPVPGVSAGAYHYEGKDGRNFANEGERQVLVRATREQLDGLLDELAQATGDGDRIALAAGPLSIKGLARSRAALYGLEASSQFASDTSDDALFGIQREIESDGVSPENEAASPDGLLDGVLRVAGVDPGVFRSLAAASAAKPWVDDEIGPPTLLGSELAKAQVVQANRPFSSAAPGEISSTLPASAPPPEPFANKQVVMGERESSLGARAKAKPTVSRKSRRGPDANLGKASSATRRDDKDSLARSRRAVGFDDARIKKSKIARAGPRDVAASNLELGTPISTNTPVAAHRMEAAPIEEYIILVVRIVPPRKDSAFRPARARPKPPKKREGPRQ